MDSFRSGMDSETRLTIRAYRSAIAISCLVGVCKFTSALSHLATRLDGVGATLPVCAVTVNGLCVNYFRT